MNDRLVGIVGIIAWSHNRWKGFDDKGFKNRNKYPEYIKQTGAAHEWWNFYEGFNERYYIGHIQISGKKLKFHRGLIVFISRNVNDGKHYFVGFYGKGEYSENGFKTGKKVVELLPRNYILWAKEVINKKEIEEKNAKYVRESISGDAEYVSNYRGGKEFSTVFDEEGFVEIQASDIGFKKFGQAKFSYIGDMEKVKPEKVRLLLLKAKQKHEELLQKDISEDRRKDIGDTIRKIDWVLETYFEGGSLHMGEIVEKLREILHRGKGKYDRIWSENWREVHKFHLEKLNKIIRGDTIQGKQWEGIKREIDRLFWWSAGGVGEIDQNSYEQYREFLTKLKEAGSKENIVSIIREYYRKVSGLGVKSAFSCAAIMYPNLFAPLWGSAAGSGVFNEYNIKFLGLSNEDLESIETIDGYLDFLNKLEIAAKEEDIDNLLEAAFYMMKFKLEPLTPPTIQSLRGYYKSKGYLFPSSLISQFYVAIKTKGFVILSGLSGTGKTKLATEITELLRSNVVKYVPEYASEKFIAKNSLFLSVRPDWRDSKPLLGYYNPLSGEYYETELLKFILRAKKDYEKNRKNAMPHIIILDEMNLAHVEYYFAEFLSVLESGRDNSELTRDSIKLHDVDKVAEKQGIPKEIKLPPNLYILGTVNVDETTYMFSPKVLDRAFTIEFRDVDLQGYPPENAENFDWSELQKTVIDDLRRGGKFTAYAKDEINHAVNELKGTQYWKFLNELNKTLEPYDLHFGYRIIDEIALFYKNAKESQEKGVVEFEDDNEIFDLAILMKILPKFHGNRRRLEIPLKSVLKYCLESDSGLKVDELDSEKVKDLLENWQSKQSEFKFKYTAKKVLRMLRQLYEVGFSSFF